MNVELKRTDAQDHDFVALVKELDKGLAITDGKDHAFYDQYNQLDSIKYVVVAYENGIPLGCGAIKIFDKQNMEVKRMFVSENARGKGIAGKILANLEDWTQELKYTKCILETGVRQKAAIRLYEKKGYSRMTNYGQYSGVKDSICFMKML